MGAEVARRTAMRLGELEYNMLALAVQLDGANAMVEQERDHVEQERKRHRLLRDEMRKHLHVVIDALVFLDNGDQVSETLAEKAAAGRKAAQHLAHLVGPPDPEEGDEAAPPG
jgi:uncharacterized coiled-coil protein SlyX